MRSRVIRPSFFKDEELSDVDPLARILYQGLWCMADREGRLKDRPRRIKAEVLPYDDCDLSHLMTQLASIGYIVRYKVDEIDYISIPAWSKAWVHHKEVASVLPEPPSMLKSSMTQDKIKNEPTTGRRSNKAKNKNKKENKKENENKNGYPDDFEEWWIVFPKKVAKGDALSAWESLKKKGVLPSAEKLIEITRGQLAGPPDTGLNKDQKYIPHPASWIRGRRWEDESPDAKPPEPDTIPCPKCEGHGSYLAKRYPACAEEELFSCQNCKRTGRIPK
jgi:hypothetical protein